MTRRTISLSSRWTLTHATRRNRGAGCTERPARDPPGRPDLLRHHARATLRGQDTALSKRSSGEAPTTERREHAFEVVSPVAEVRSLRRGFQYGLALASVSSVSGV